MTDTEALALIAEDTRFSSRGHPLQEDGSFRYRIPSAQITALSAAKLIKQTFTPAYRITTVRLTAKGRKTLAGGAR